MEKLTKQDLRGPDVFISTMDRVSHWSYARRKEILSLTAIIVIAGITWAIMGTYTAKQEDASAETLFGAEKTMLTIEQSFTPTKMPPTEKGKKPTEVPAAKTKSGDINTDYKAAIDQLKDVVTRFPKTQGAVMASLDLAHLYTDYNKPDEAIATLQEASKVANNTTTQAIVLTSLGVAFENKGDCHSAIDQWQKISENSEMGPFQANILIKEALCYEKLNQKDKALQILGKFEAAEVERKKLLESMAAKNQISLNVPLQAQPKKNVEAFEKEASKSKDVARIEALLSNRDAVKAAKKYLAILKQGQS